MLTYSIFVGFNSHIYIPILKMQLNFALVSVLDLFLLQYGDPCYICMYIGYCQVCVYC